MLRTTLSNESSPFTLQSLLEAIRTQLSGRCDEIVVRSETQTLSITEMSVPRNWSTQVYNLMASYRKRSCLLNLESIRSVKWESNHVDHFIFIRVNATIVMTNRLHSRLSFILTFTRRKSAFRHSVPLYRSTQK